MSNTPKLKCTKGIWKLNYFEHKYTISIDNFPKKVIARIGAVHASTITTLEHEANGYLLVASPKMYAGIEKAIKHLDPTKDKKLRAELRAILRQARGPI